MADRDGAAAGGGAPSQAKKPATAAGVDNTARRTWDLDEYRERAAEKEAAAAAAVAVGTKAGAEAAAGAAAELRRQKRVERDPLHQGLIAARSDLRARDRELDLEARLGMTQMVVAGAAAAQQAGYFCSVCDCTLRDSQTYLSHINGKYHNRALGMSMRAERSTAEQVRRRLREAGEAQRAGGGGDKRQKAGVGGGGEAAAAPSRPSMGPGGALLLMAPAEAAAARRAAEGPVPLRDGIARADGSEEGDGDDGGGDEDEDDEDDGRIAPGAEPYVPDGFDRRVLEAQEREEREREARKRAKADKRRGQAQEAAAGGGGVDGGGDGADGGLGLDPEMAAMMGFGGFGGGVKGR